jgi:alkaline phosphatase
VDVVLGGGVYKTAGYCDVYAESFAPADKRQYIIDLAVADGYEFVTTDAELEAAVAAGNTKVLGMFEQAGIGAGKTPEYFWVDEALGYPVGEPTLAEMTEAALDILEKDRDGLFLMVEGSQIDWADHANNTAYQVAESLAFDESVKVVLDWVNARPERKNDTLVIIVADHDTAGFAITGPYNAITGAGEMPDTDFVSGDHTAVDTIIYSQGPGSENLGAALDNTDLYYVMKDALR